MGLLHVTEIVSVGVEFRTHPGEMPTPTGRLPLAVHVLPAVVGRGRGSEPAGH